MTRQNHPIRRPPQRPRSHQLETESRNAIRAAIPSSWVYRDLDQDYGVDSEVEIFDSAGSARGAKFLLQLKATDEPDLRRALRVSFDESKLQYFSSLDLPVLIVRYHAPSKRLFARWFHNFDWSCRTRGGRRATFVLEESHVWDDSKPIRLAEELEAFRETRTTRLRGPLHFALSIEDPAVYGIPRNALSLNLRASAKHVRHLVELHDAPSPASASHAIFVTEKTIKVLVGGSLRFRCDGLAESFKSGAGSSSSLHCDIMIFLGLALDKSGYSLEAADIISRFWRDANISSNFDVALQLAQCFANANQMNAALEISEVFFRDSFTIDAAQVALLPVFAKWPQLRDSERRLGVELLTRMAHELELRSQLPQAAALHYTCANLLRSLTSPGRALRAYRRAAQLDASYLERDYYSRELAGVLYIGRRYALAAKYYERSLAIKTDRRTQLLLADAYMFSGLYEKAEELFIQTLTVPVEMTDSEWALKRWALREIREQTGLGEQRRTSPSYDEAFGRTDVPAIEIEKISREALQKDALAALAWYNLGIVQYRSGDHAQAAKYFLLAALIERGDLEAWGNAIAIFIQLSNTDLLSLSLCAAFEIHGERLLLHLAERQPDAGDRLVTILTDFLATIPRRIEDFTVRLHSAAGDWDEVSLSQSRETQ